MSWFDDFDWKVALKTIAPTVASIFGTPLAGAGVAALLEAIFPADDVNNLTPAEQEQKLAVALKSGQLTPEQYAALAAADLAFRTRCVDAGIDLERIAAGDRDSARKREMAVKDWTPAVLATIACIGFFGSLAVLFYVPLPAENRDIITMLLGQLSAVFAGVFAYYFGTTVQSLRKTAALVDLAGRNSERAAA